MKVALVYDRVNKWGGAERVLLALHEIFPKAPLYTSVYNPKTAPWASVFEIKTSFLQKIPKAKSSHELFAMLMPFAFESFSFDDYDVVISVTSEAAKGINTKGKTVHLCYCLTPTRYLWSGYHFYFKNKVFRLIAKPAVRILRNWDKKAARKPHAFIAISKEVQKRIKEYYGRESTVIYPPVNLPYASRISYVANDARQAQINHRDQVCSLSESRLKDQVKSKTSTGSGFSSFASRYAFGIYHSYYLIVSRLVPYKKIDLAIKAFNKLKLPLVIVGSGSIEKRLKRMSGSTIRFVGNLTDNELLRYYKGCRALVFPGKEDFGLTILEAQLLGKPVIAFKDGGALETIIERKTGLFFYPQKEQALIAKIKEFENLNIKAQDCVEQAKKFNKERFKKEFLKILNQKIKEFF